MFWRRLAKWVQPVLMVLIAAQAVSDDRAGARGEDWPRWRGPRGDGTWNGPALAETWPKDGPRRVWRKEIGGGYAGVSVAGGRVYLFDRQTKPHEVERLLCLSSENGDVIWEHEYSVKYGELQYGNGPRAAPTVEGNRVYILGSLGDLRCLETDGGKPVWSANFPKDFQGRLPTWGYAAAPFLYKDRLIVLPGGPDGRCVVALDPTSGKQIWGSLSDEAGYAPPLVAEHNGRPQLVCWTPSHIRAVDPADGKLCWSVPYAIEYGVSIASPIFQEGLVFVSAYWAGSKAIRPVAAGKKPDVVYEENRNLRGLMSQPLYREGHAYLLDKQYGLTCFELKTGRKIWDDNHKMTPRGRNPQATLVWLGNSERAIILNSEGELILARLNPQGYHEMSRTKILGETWAHPAYAGRYVFARSDTELVCYELPTAE